jgi:predicted nucleic acid-binding protein
MRVLLDTNVLIDFYNKREPFYRDAFKLRVMQEFGDVELWASVQSFSDISFVLRDVADTEKLQQAFLASLSFLRVCSLDQGDLEKVCHASWADLEDCMIEQCSKKIKAEYLLTRDPKGFSKSAATVLNPSEFFTAVFEQYGLTYDSLECPAAPIASGSFSSPLSF